MPPSGVDNLLNCFSDLDVRGIPGAQPQPQQAKSKMLSLERGPRMTHVDAKACLVCRNITISKLASPDGYQHHPSFEALGESIDAGCKLCFLIRYAILRVGGKLGTYKQEWWYEIQGQTIKPGIVLYWRKDVGFQQTIGRYVRRDDNILCSEQIYISWNWGPSAGLLDNPKDNVTRLTLYIDEGM